MLVAFSGQVHMLYLVERFQHNLICMRIVREGPTLITFLLFLVDEGREDQNVTLSGPSSVRQRNVI